MSSNCLKTKSSAAIHFQETEEPQRHLLSQMLSRNFRLFLFAFVICDLETVNNCFQHRVCALFWSATDGYSNKVDDLLSYRSRCIILDVRSADDFENCHFQSSVPWLFCTQEGEHAAAYTIASMDLLLLILWLNALLGGNRFEPAAKKVGMTNKYGNCNTDN